MTVRFKKISLDGLVAGLILGIYLLHYSYILWKGYIKIFPDSDAQFYWEWSTRFWLGKVSLPFLGVPGYPIFLAISRPLFPTVEVQILLNHLLTAFSGWLLYRLTSHLAGRQWGFLAACVFLGYTPFLMYSSILTPEPLALLLLGIGLSKAMTVEKVSTKEAVFLGLVWGLLSIVRPVFLLFGLVLGAFLGMSRRFQDWRRAFFGYYLAFLLFPGMIVGLNGVLGGFWGISTHAGVNFFLGNSSHSTGTFYTSLPFRPTQSGLIEDARIVASKVVGKPLTASQSCRFWMEKSGEFIVSHPRQWLKLMGKKILLLFNAYEYHDANWKSMKIPLLPFLDFGFVFPFALLGLWTTRKDRRAGVLRLCTVITALGTSLFFVNTRYKMMVVFPAIPLAVLGVRDFVEVLMSRRYFSAIVYSAILGSLFLLGRVDWLKVMPSRSAIQFNEAMELFEKGDLNSAKKMLLDIIRYSPSDYLSWFALGNIYFLEGETSKAMDCYHRSHALNRFFADAVFNYGVCAMKLGKYDVAYRCFLQLYRVSPHKPDVALNLAFTLAKLGQCESARRLLTEVSKRVEEVDLSEVDIQTVEREVDSCQKKDTSSSSVSE